MSVLTLAGKPIDWANPPARNTKVMWSGKTTSGKPVIGSLYAIAHLDHLNRLAIKKYGVPISVFQSAFNTTVEASEGTHNFDMCFDVWIPGVDGPEQQRFFRANGGGAYLRVPPTFSLHIHYFTLPPRGDGLVSEDYARAGFKVGKYVDGGYSLFGRPVGSSQIGDYYTHRNALSGHAHDPSWFPARIEDSIFDLPAYIARQRALMEPTSLIVQTTNIEDKAKPPLGPSLREVKPHVAAVQQGAQASRYFDALNHYDLFEFSKGAEAREIKALVRDGVKVLRVKRLNMRRRWVGPKIAREHAARTYMAVKVKTPFRAWVLNVHFPTGGPDGPNAEAWMESWDRVALFLSKRRGVAVGDFNATAEELARLVKSEGFLLTSLGKVDHAISNRLRTTKVQRDLPATPPGVHGWGAVSYVPVKKK